VDVRTPDARIRGPEGTIMYEKEATLMVKALQARVPGRPSASKGPGPSATVRYQLESAPITFEVTFVGGKLTVQASRDPDGIVWGVREHPISAAGVALAIAEMAEWAGRQTPAS
jgi:hypothetical protein